MSTRSTTLLSRALHDILNTIDLTADALTAQVASRQLTAESPSEMRARLTYAIYEHFHLGRDDAETETTRPRSLRESGFENLLAAQVPHTDSVQDVTLIEKDSGHGDLIVRYMGVRVRALSTRVLKDVVPEVGAVVPLKVESSRPALSPGFFMVSGSLGSWAATPAVRRMFIGVDNAKSAPAVWGRVLTFLETSNVRYQAKVLSSPALYPRQDAIVVYLPNEAAPVEHKLAAHLQGTAGLGTSTSGFALRLAEGVAFSWDPVDQSPGMQGLSFGQHRATVLARTLVEQTLTKAVREELVARRFTAANIDPTAPWRNLSSPESPFPIPSTTERGEKNGTSDHSR
ncbi:T3SS effector HopA1 family protein [Arthrobacter sp. Z1-15]